MLVFSTGLTLWRVIVRFKASPCMDWLMILGTVCTLNMLICRKTPIIALVMNVAAISVAIACGLAGAGRLLRDPFWTLDKKIYQNHNTFISQLLNVYGM